VLNAVVVALLVSVVVAKVVRKADNVVVFVLLLVDIEVPLDPTVSNVVDVDPMLCVVLEKRVVVFLEVTANVESEVLIDVSNTVDVALLVMLDVAVFSCVLKLVR
jgi:hypothetical protein